MDTGLEMEEKENGRSFYNYYNMYYVRSQYGSADCGTDCVWT